MEQITKNNTTAGNGFTANARLYMKINKQRGARNNKAVSTLDNISNLLTKIFSHHCAIYLFGIYPDFFTFCPW
jgi:hypothetical protein